MTLTLVVVLYNSRDAFANLWKDLQRQSCRDWQLIVIDNASSDGSAAFMGFLGDPRVWPVFNKANVGFAAAVNQGLRIAIQAGAERCLLLNPDVALEADFLQALGNRWRASGADVIAPRIMRMDDPARSWYAGGHLNFGWTFQNVHEEYTGKNGKKAVTDFASGCCLGLTSKIIHIIGLFDDRFFVYWEDTDYCLRLKSMGIPIDYAPEIVIFHESGASSGGESSLTALDLYYRSYVQLLWKHFGAVVTLRTIARVLRRENARQGMTRKKLSRITLAMTRGLRASLAQKWSSGGNTSHDPRRLPPSPPTD